MNPKKHQFFCLSLYNHVIDVSTRVRLVTTDPPDPRECKETREQSVLVVLLDHRGHKESK